MAQLSENVKRGSVSGFGSVNADAPGMVREWGYTKQFVIAPTTTHDAPICSATAPSFVTDYQQPLAPLEPGDGLFIFGQQAVGAANTTPLTWSIEWGYNEDRSDSNKMIVGTANRNGPWFQHFELPLGIYGPPDSTQGDGKTYVWLDIINTGASPTSFNKITLEVFEYRKPGT